MLAAQFSTGEWLLIIIVVLLVIGGVGYRRR